MAANEGRKKVFWWLVYVLWIVLDVEGVWDKSHFLCILLAVFGTICVSFAEFDSNVVNARISLIAIIIGIMVYYFAPPNLPVETETHGWLVAGNQPFPEKICNNEVNGPKWTPESMIVFTGTSNKAMAFGIDRVPENKKVKILKLGKCDSVAITRTADKIVLDAVEYDKDGNLVFRIENGEFHVAAGEYSYMNRSTDRTSLTVFDKKGNVMLDVNFLNPQLIKISGVFQCESSEFSPVTIGEDGVHHKFGGGVSGMCIWGINPGDSSLIRMFEKAFPQ